MAGRPRRPPAARAVQVVVEDERVKKDVLVTPAKVLAAAHAVPATPNGGVRT
ncbi:hypothetical protein ACIF6L_28790 [Kitasatospora sp. NPDC086009]|uniref:hypothetical protein n=1 Tax=unclassified Kitasatospora TaxID=2633591 RepID=UPI0037C87A88